MNDSAQSLPYDPKQAPPDYVDPVVEYYKKDVDRTLLRENLKLTVEERLQKFVRIMKSVGALREAGQLARKAGKL